MPLLPEDSSEYTDEWIEDLRLEIDLALSIVHEYLASRDGKPPSATSSIVKSDDALSYQTSETFLNDDSSDKLDIDVNLKMEKVQEIVSELSECLVKHGIPQPPPLSTRIEAPYDLELENVSGAWKCVERTIWKSVRTQISSTLSFIEEDRKITWTRRISNKLILSW